MKNKIFDTHERYLPGDLQLSFYHHKHAMLSTHRVFSTPWDSVGGDSENFNTRVRQLLLESLTHSLAGHHLETTIDLRRLGE